MKLFMFLVAVFATMASSSLNAQNTYKISLAGQTTDTISRQEIAANPVVAVIGIADPVTFFELTYMNTQGDLIVMPSGSNQMTESMLQVVKTPAVKKIFIENASFSINGGTLEAGTKKIYLKD